MCVVLTKYKGTIFTDIYKIEVSNKYVCILFNFIPTSSIEISFVVNELQRLGCINLLYDKRDGFSIKPPPVASEFFLLGCLHYTNENV